MPRRKKLDPSVKITIYLPASLATKIDLHLYSELEGRVPFNSRSVFFETAAAKYLASVTGVSDD